MFLKVLELQGFKSFVKRTRLEFGDGITAVVGPNGSGKSNLVDAIRWVLGEQSARTLRGLKMEDLIFAGSEGQRPVGMAEVTLTLDNSQKLLPLEYNEVAVTRRLFRSGESEYAINRTVCRLRDIVELLLDTGIGRDSMTILGQGQLEQVLNSRPEERRWLIEEVGGISRFRYRKQEAMRKLEQTEVGLERLDDLLAELELQLEPLAVETKLASRHRQLIQEIRYWEAALAWEQLTTIQQNLSLLNKETIVKEAEKLQCTEDFDRCKHQQQQVYQNWENSTQHVDELQVVTLRQSQCLERERSQVEVWLARQRDLQETCHRRLNAVRELETNLGNGQADHQALLQRLVEERQLVLELEQQLVQTRDQQQLWQGELAQLDAQKENIRAQLQELGRRLAQAEGQHQSLKARAEHDQVVQDALEHEKEELQIELQRLGKEVTEAADSVSSKEQERQETRTALDAARIQLKSWREEQDKVLSRLRTTRSRWEVLREVRLSHEGYQAGVKAVMQARSKDEPSWSGVLGTVAELIQVPPRLARAIEVALGGALQHLVVVDREAAHKAITFLKHNRAGRATFLPLDILHPRSLPHYAQPPWPAGVIGCAAELVGAAQEIQVVVQNLLGQVLVACDLEVATVTAGATGFRIRVVTLEGEVVHPGGSMTGGQEQRSNSAGLLGRSKQLEELHEQVQIEQERAASIGQLVSDHERLIHDLEVSMQDLSVQLERMQRHNGSVRTRMEQTRLRFDRVLQQWEQQQQIQQQLLEQLHTQQGGTDSSDNENQGPEQQRLDDDLNRILGEITAAQEQREMAGILGEQLSDRLNSQQQLLARLEERESRMAVELQELNSRLAAEQVRLQQAAEQEMNIIAEIQPKKIALQELEAEVQNLTSQLDQVRNQQSADQGLRHQLEANLDQCQQRLMGINNRLEELRVTIARLESELETRQLHFEEQYAVIETQQLRVGEAKARREINQLRRELVDLGPVKPGVEAEYQRLQERYQFLDSQRADLLQAKSELELALNRVDQEMAGRFQTTLSAVDEAFNQVFGELFEGGFARLELLGAQLLTAGIEVVAQPPGKKLQHLSLLSGGERALTAIALLFALLRVKPSPFCVLDEIDASLDTVNGDRFMRFLRHYTGTTQFILVSHRAATVEAAKALYGVTMSNSGTSQVVSLRLDQVADQDQTG